MAQHQTPDVDPKTLNEAHQMWTNFLKGGKYAIIATCVVLVLMALAFVKFT